MSPQVPRSPIGRQWRRAGQSGVDPPNSGQIRQHLVGEAHRRVLVRIDTGLDLSTFPPGPTERRHR